MSRWRRVVRRELARFEEQTGSDVVELGDFLDQSRAVFVAEFPDNDHVDAKVRQVLQQLRDRGEVDFLDDAGRYRIRDLGTDRAADVDEVTPDYTAAEYETVVGARSIPAAFRAHVLDRYGHRCPVSGVDHDRLLDVAHVLPWSGFPDHRTDPRNVLPLSRTHHAAFDAGLFTLDTDYRLQLDPDFETESDVLRRTLVERADERVEVDVASDYLDRHNRRLDWW
ncbi:HNH endonuclease [Halospeciosus flavus]|uniref:HNH endonuclease n=1 Tax=Halospeciosus flavus TaxID=3032283 RepID=A0ABD5Z5F7_9EURY|nr:HNH endonuclease [Halospeciosus flavus]